MKKMLIAFSALALVFTACKKDDVSKAVTPTKENLTGNYMITAATVSSGGVSVNVFDNADASQNFFDACDRDDKYELKADLSYDVVDAGTQCSPDNNYTGGAWALTNSTTIDIDGEVGTIDSFDGKTLVVSQTSGSVKSTVTYVKQ